MGRLFGTNGVRGVVNDGLDAAMALRLGLSVGTHLGAGKRVALGTDARTSSPMLAAAVTAGLTSAGIHVVRLGVAPSPAIQLYVKAHPQTHLGVIITASHNPPRFNGIKIVAGDGTEADAAQESAIEAVYFSERFAKQPWDRVGGVRDEPGANAAYREAVISNTDAEACKRARLRVVVDPAGGPACLTSPEVLRALGCDVVTIHGELDGAFTGRASETTEDNLGALKQRVKDEKANLGVAHDGDADRCIFIDEKGAYVPGDKSFAVIAKRIVAQARGGVVCTNVATSNLVRDVVVAAGGEVEWTAVGSPIVARRMIETNAVFGGEENGGLIFPDLQFCRDGAMTMAKMVEILATTGVPLSQLVAELPQYHVSKQKFECADDRKAALIARVKAALAQRPDVRVDVTDGVKAYLADGAWVLIRPSGTEPIFRVYAESRDAARAEAVAKEFVDLARGLLAS